MLTVIDADAAVPPLLLLQARVARADDPARMSSGRFASPYSATRGIGPGRSCSRSPMS